MPRRPARPVSCVYSPGVRNSWRSPVNFESFSITTDRAGMLMPSASVSVANTTFTSPAANASSTASFIGGTMPGVVGGEPGLEPGEPAPVVEHVEVVVGERGGLALDDGADLGPLAGVGEAEAGAEALLDRLVAAGPAEHEVDRGQHPLGGQQLDGLDPSRRAQAAAAPVALATARSPARGCSGRRRAGRPRGWAERAVGPSADERREQVEALGAALRDQVAVLEPHRPALLDDRGGRPAHGLDPGRDLLGVRHRRREAHQPHRRGEVDDHLLPHRAPVAVLEVVHLVEHDDAQAVERGRRRRRSCCAAPRWSSRRRGRRRSPSCRR